MRTDLGRVVKQCEPTGEFTNTESANSEDRLVQDLEGGKGKKPLVVSASPCHSRETHRV